MNIPKIDAHQHFWQRSQPFDYKWLDNPKLAKICGDYLPDDLKVHLDHRNIDGSIFVQTQHNLLENDWVLSLCDQNSYLLGMVGWVDLASRECEDQLLKARQNPKFLGVRHVVQDEPDDNFLIRTDVLRGLSILEKHHVPFDVLIYVKHLKHVPTLARKFPTLKMVINHLAKPQIASHGFAYWQRDFVACAKYENVFCKLSGMVTEADWEAWQPADLKPYIDQAIEAFSPSRLMFGSDWPVCELAASYEQVHDALAENIATLTTAEQSEIFAGTARRYYELNGLSATMNPA